MENVNVAEFGSTEKTTGNYSYKLSSPMPFLWTMVLFLIIVGFIAAILFRQTQTAFMHNPGLNGLILGVLAVGIILVFSHVLSLRPEVRWFNSFRAAGSADKVGRNPKLLAPMRTLIGSRSASAGISTAAFRSILDSIANRLDESRDVSRYLIGLLVFLGLLGTFWGLIGTIGSISSVIQTLDAGSNGSTDVLGALKEGLSMPLSGMGQAFSSSLLGFASGCPWRGDAMPRQDLARCQRPSVIGPSVRAVRPNDRSVRRDTRIDPARRSQPGRAPALSSGVRPPTGVRIGKRDGTRTLRT